MAQQSIYVNDSGPAEATNSAAFLLLHGAGLNGSVWQGVAQGLASTGRRALVPDFPGHGRSGDDPLTTIEAMADSLARMLPLHTSDPVVVVGHSMGSLVALDFAARYPALVSSLVMVGTAVPMPVAPSILERAQANDPSVYVTLARYGLGPVHVNDAGESLGSGLYEAQLDLFRHCADGVLFADMSACNDYVQGLHRAAQVTCPSYLILGEEDRLTPVVSAQGLLEALQSPTVTRVPQAGHSLMAEAPAAVLEVLRAL